jgi:hypothetical protein
VVGGFLREGMSTFGHCCMPSGMMYDSGLMMGFSEFATFNFILSVTATHSIPLHGYSEFYGLNKCDCH